MKRWIDRTPREQAAINAIATPFLWLAKALEAVGAVWVIGAALLGLYIVGAVAWSLVTRL